MPELKPSSLYTVKILSSDEFDKLPFKHVKTSLGAANAKTGIAYVRDTGYNDITKDTIAHELDELMAKVSPHEEDGIRYKNLGSVLGGFGNAAKSIAQPVASGIGKIGGAAIGGLKKAGGVFGKFLGGGGSQPTPSGALGGFSGIPGGAGTAAAFASNKASGGGNALGQFLNNTPQISSAGTQSTTAPSGGNQILDLFKDIAAPLAVSSLGNAFAPKVETPDFSGATQGLRDQITGQQPSELRGLAEEALKGRISDPNEAPPEEVFTQGDLFNDEQLQDDLKNLEQLFKRANPNVNVANNSSFLRERDRLVERSRERRTAERDKVSFDFVQQQQQLKLQEIQTALNLDTAQINQLVQLAQLDINEIMLQTGIEFGEAQQIKQLFGDLGSVIAQKTIG